jgi:predicted thioredoxin/glutaredoxin
MAKKKSSKTGSRTEWLDDKSDTPLIGQYVERLGSFLDAMADGKIEPGELKAQEARVAALMKSIEPKLDDALHEQVTHLLCELSAYNIMHTVHDLVKEQPKTKFRG